MANVLHITRTFKNKGGILRGKKEFRIFPARRKFPLKYKRQRNVKSGNKVRRTNDFLSFCLLDGFVFLMFLQSRGFGMAAAFLENSFMKLDGIVKLCYIVS